MKQWIGTPRSVVPSQTRQSMPFKATIFVVLSIVIFMPLKLSLNISSRKHIFHLTSVSNSRYSTHVSMDDIHAVNSARLYYPSKPVRDPAYRRFIRQLPCAACGKSRYVDAAHTGPHGFGQKASDLNCIPLCARSCHREYDQNPRLFAARMKIDVPGVVSKLNTFWFEKLNGGAA